MPALLRLALLICAGLLVGCASTSSTVDPRGGGKSVVAVDYPRLPMTAGTKVFRGILKGVPGADGFVFWGNYGGPGNEGGPPVDAMDVLFLEHDLVYVRKDSFRSLRAADRVLADSLEQLDPSALSPDSRKFRKRAIFYMRSPFGTLGKVIGTINNPPPPPGLPSFEELGPYPFPELKPILGPLVSVPEET